MQIGCTHACNICSCLSPCSLLTFTRSADYNIGDIVFCKVRGRYIDAHKIIKIDGGKGFLIANNHGFENGWTKTIYGRVTLAEYLGKVNYQVP